MGLPVMILAVSTNGTCRWVCWQKENCVGVNSKFDDVIYGNRTWWHIQGWKGAYANAANRAIGPSVLGIRNQET